MRHAAIRSRSRPERRGAAIAVLVVGFAGVGVLAANVVIAPSVGDTAARLSDIEGWAVVAVVTIAAWASVSLVLFGLAARAASRRDGGPFLGWMSALRDVLWVSVPVSLGSLVPATIFSLTAHGSNVPFAMAVDGGGVAIAALTAGLAAAIVTVVIAAR